MNKPIKLAIVDDDGVFRDFLDIHFKKIKGFKIIIKSSNGKEFIDTIILKKQKPDVVLLNLQMPVMDGIETTAYLTKYHPEIKKIILTVQNSKSVYHDLLKKGADGFLPKKNGIEHIINAIYAVVEHQEYFVGKDLKKIFNVKNKNKGAVPSNNIEFTRRELEIIDLLCTANTSKEISAKLFIGKRTVDWHIGNIFKKADVKNSTKLRYYAKENSLIVKKNKKIGVLKEIKKLAGGNKLTEKKLRDIVVLQTSQKLLLIKSCLENNDWAELKKIAHFLKSNFITLNLSKAAEITETIRTKAGINIEATNKQAQELINICEQIISELQNNTEN